tara:strand:+ start:191 stop:397 length:207 start_codon:yes stop_codon:yes gene_type:complete
MKSKKRKPKRKSHKTSDPTWNTHTYGNHKNIFDIEWMKYFNPIEGRDQILFLYSCKETKKIRKYRVMR